MTDNRLILNPDFLLALGGFHGAWSSLEVLLSYSIGHTLNIPVNETHMLTSGMEFGRKATLLRNLIHRGDRKNKAQIIGLIGRLQNESLRNVFAHGMITSSRDTVTFIDRSRHGDYRTTKHVFTLKQFIDHVVEVGEIAANLQVALGVPQQEIHDFVMAALNDDTKSTKSPVPPSEIA